MTIVRVLVLFLFFQTSAWGQATLTWEGGLMANLNTSQLSVTSPQAASRVTSNQWTAGFGIFVQSSEFKMNYLEGILAFEVTGSSKTIYYVYGNDQFARIPDRYRTIPLIITINRYLGERRKLAIGVGIKSSLVVSYGVRHEDPLPPSTTGLIQTAEPRKWFGSPVLQITAHFTRADISLSGWYALTPLIKQFSVHVVPYGVSFGVKYRVFP
jgi:hypothetical protein